MARGRTSTKTRVSLDDLLPPDFLDDLLPEQDRDALAAEREGKKASYANIKKQLAALAEDDSRSQVERAKSRAKPTAFITFWNRHICLCGARFESPRSLKPLVKYERADGTVLCQDEPWRNPQSLPYEVSWSEAQLTRCHHCQPTSLPFYPLVVAGPLRIGYYKPQTLVLRSERDAHKCLDVKPKPRVNAHFSSAGSASSHIHELQHDIEIIRFAYGLVEEIEHAREENLDA